MCLSAIQGDDNPDGTAAFHSRFVPALNSIGGLSFSATPAAFGPRNCGHKSLAADKFRQAERITTVIPRFMMIAARLETKRESTASTIFTVVKCWSPRSPKLIGRY